MTYRNSKYMNSGKRPYGLLRWIDIKREIHRVFPEIKLKEKEFNRRAKEIHNEIMRAIAEYNYY